MSLLEINLGDGNLQSSVDFLMTHAAANDFDDYTKVFYLLILLYYLLTILH